MDFFLGNTVMKLRNYLIILTKLFNVEKKKIYLLKFKKNTY